MSNTTDLKFVRLVTYCGEITEDCSEELLNAHNLDYTQKEEFSAESDEEYFPLTHTECELMFSGESPSLHGGNMARYVDAYLETSTSEKYLLLSDEDFSTDEEGKARVKKNLPSAIEFYKKMAQATGGKFGCDHDGAELDGSDATRYDVMAYVPFSFFARIENNTQMSKFLEVCDFESKESVDKAFELAIG